jgi:hypothetical protein
VDAYHDAKRAMRRMRRRAHLDFSDYLELRRFRDLGAQSPELDGALQHLEHALPVTFSRALPHLATQAGGAPPRGLSQDALRVAFAMREEIASRGKTRAGMMGFDLPEGEGLKDWLDLVETERKLALESRHHLRDFDRRLWALFTGDRRMPQAATLQ